jgi:3',5'-cyclic AMP phosphodiesterase CpdA
MAMGYIRILHASDLHISIHKQLRSPLDRLGDIRDSWDVPSRAIADALRLPKSFLTSWWKKMSASSYDPETLEALAEFIYENAKRKLDAGGNEITEEGDGKLDAVVITGDLATTGSTDDVEMVSKFLRATFNPRHPHRSRESDYRGATLSAVRVPVLCLPGNHDRFVPTHERYMEIFPIFFKPGGTEFDLLVADYSQGVVHSIELTDELSHGRRLRVVVLAADLTLGHFDDHTRLFGWLAQGKAHVHVCRRLVAMTERLREQKKEDEVLCVLWAIHFPPDFPGVHDHSRLISERKLIKAANRAGVHAVLAGHTHQQLTYHNPSMSFKVFCCGTTTQHEPRASVGGGDERDATKGNFFQIITVTADGADRVELSTRDYRFTSAGGQGWPGHMRWSEDPSALG